MAKITKVSRNKKTESKSLIAKFNLDELLPQKYHLLAVILVIVILFLAFLNPLYFGGKTFESGDIISSKSMSPYILNHKDGFTLWNPLIFCGMPAYALGTSTVWFNVIGDIYNQVRVFYTDLFSVQYVTWTFFLIILGITSFLLMKYLTKNTLVSLFSSLSTAFSTGIIVFLYIGHVTKLTSLCIFPLIFLLLFRMKKKIGIIDFLLLIIALQLMLQGFHAQIISYIFFSVAIYFIYFFISALYKKEKDQQRNLVKTAGLFVIAATIALLIQADSITQIYQYTPYSTRGGKSIVEKGASSDNPSSSEYYDYHTMWSFSPGEVLTFVVPSYYGFGGSTYEGALSNNQAVDVNTYFGQMPFVDVAMYMGIIILVLGLFAMVTRWREPIVQFFGILVIISLLISFGKNFPILFNLLFYHLPYFDKFRVPSMILVLVQLSFPVLAGFGLMKIISLKENRNITIIKLIKNIAFLSSGLFVVSLIMKGPISDWFVARVNDYTLGIQQSQPQLAQQFSALSPYMADMFTNDLLIAIALIAITFWLAHVYINSKISKDVLVAAIIILTIFDLFRIDSRDEKYVNNPDIKNMFNTPNYVSAIKKQKDKVPFRMLNIKQDQSLGSLSNNSNYNAYFMLEDFYGYSGVKPRAYQDLMDVIGPVNPTLWRMLNVRYIVADQQIPYPGFIPIYQQGKEIVYKNNNALPRIYFVDKVDSLPGLEVLNNIKTNSFDPKNEAFINGNFPQINKPDSTAFVDITNYKDETIELNVKASGNNFLFFGDTYLPTGWKAYIDGNKTLIYKVNHSFMGIVVTKGNHKVEFVYAPTSFYISKYLSLGLSSLVVFGLFMAFLIKLKRKN